MKEQRLPRRSGRHRITRRLTTMGGLQLGLLLVIPFWAAIGVLVWLVTR